jgi:beta-lactamase class C
MNQTFLPERGPDTRAILVPRLLKNVVQGYAYTGMAIGPPGDQQSYYDFPGTGQMFSSARDLATFLAALIDGAVIDPQLRQALQMTQRETFQVTGRFGQAMAWEHVHFGDVDVVDKPGGLNNASAYVGLVPAHKIGIVLLANSGEFPHEIARDRVLPELARED